MATEEKKENGSIVTLPFRLAFPEIFEARSAVEGGRERFSITMLFPQDGSPLIPSMPGNGLVAIRKLLFEAAKEKFGGDREKWPANLKALDFKAYVSPDGRAGWPIRSGSEVTWTGFEGMLFVKASSQFQPGIVNQKLQPIIDVSDVWGGLICRAQVSAYGYSQAGNNGVALNLSNLQVLRDDGITFTGKARPELVFDAFGDAGATTSGDAWD